MHTLRVLIADSDPTVRQALFQGLLDIDVFSDCVSTVPDALARLRDDSYGVVLVDVSLTGGDPDQLVDAIGALGRDRRPVVLVLAANPSAARSLDVDVVQIVLRKPVAVRQTVELIRSCLQNTAFRRSEADGEGDGDDRQVRS